MHRKLLCLSNISEFLVVLFVMHNKFLCLSFLGMQKIAEVIRCMGWFGGENERLLFPFKVDAI